MSPFKGQTHHIEYMLIHLTCMFTGWNIGPPTEGLLYMAERKNGKQRKGSNRGSLSKRNWEHQRWSG